MSIQDDLRNENKYLYWPDGDLTLEAAADHIDTLEARIKELEQDAARYRWLRNSPWNWDAAIDEAMKDQS